MTSTDSLLNSVQVLRGRRFSPEDLAIILRCVNEHFDEGRTKISRVICNELDWKQPNGWPKDRACRDVLRSLERLGVIKLPAPLNTKRSNKTGGQIRPKPSSTVIPPLQETICELPYGTINLEFAKGNKAEKVWNNLVDNYHYLGHKLAVGRCIKYLIRFEDRILGALAFSSPAWRLGCRDEVLVSLNIDPSDTHNVVINNTRFLILPNVKIPNLASTVLALATKQVVTDWSNYYSITPLVAETFVQPSLYEGTCYKAANWVEVGMTKGYAKKGWEYLGNQETKRVLLYGLNRNIRRKLLEIVRKKEV